VDFEPRVLSFLEDLDIVNHLEVNGAAVRVPEEHITLREEVVPDLRPGMEDQVRPPA
jgi:hypothetical protein